MERFCKFCGKPINSSNTESCAECTRYCMSKCKTALNTSTNWHSEPCVSCKHNPYAIQHKWNGEKWIAEGYFIGSEAVTENEAKEVEKKNQNYLDNGDFKEMLNVKFIFTRNFNEEVNTVRKLKTLTG